MTTKCKMNSNISTNATVKGLFAICFNLFLHRNVGLDKKIMDMFSTPIMIDNPCSAQRASIGNEWRMKEEPPEDEGG